MNAGHYDRDGSLFERVGELTRDLERARFGGANPPIDVPAGASPLEIAARVLAAERANALLRLDGRLCNPQEDRAESDLRRALAAFRSWSFGAIRGLLEGAGARATDPALQQRIALWKLLADLVQRLVSADPEATLRGDPSRPALEYLDAADRLDGPESLHYRAEVGRLVAEHATARSEPTSLSRALWYLLRARLALASDEPVLAIAWCVRAARAAADRLGTDDYLGNLLDLGRRYVLLAMGELEPSAATAARDELRSFQAWDLYHALAAHLGRAFAVDAHRETSRYSIAPYEAADE